MTSTGVSRIEGIDPFVAEKAPCKVCTTSNITLSGAQTVNGVAVAETTPKTRVLVRAQTDSTENGIWDVYDTAWVRSDDFNGTRDVVEGTLVYVQDGTTYPDTLWKQTTSGAIVFGTSNISFGLVGSFSATNSVIHATVATMVADGNLAAGMYVQTIEHTSGYGYTGGNLYLARGVTAGTADNGSLIKSTGNPAIEFVGLFPNGIWWDQFGSDPSGDTDSGTEIQAAIDYSDTIRNTDGAALTSATPGKKYTFAVGLTLPDYNAANVNWALLRYTGTGTAVTLGTNTGSLNHFCKLLDFNMHLVDKAAKGVRLVSTSRAKVIGNIEGLYQPYDSTRTNVGVEVDGVDASSFFNWISVDCNHIHEGFRTTTTGTVQPTSQFFVNCSTLGDQATDATSIGFNFVDTAILGLGEGTKLIDCNIEQVNTGFYFGQNCRGIDANVRVEITSTATSRIAKYHADSDNIDLRGSGIDSAKIGTDPGGLEGFANSGTHRVWDVNGNIRVGGNDSSFAGISPPIYAIGMETILLKSNGDTAIRTTDTGTGTGSVTIQPGSLSSGYGAFLRLNAHSNATSPGDFECGSSLGAGSFRVTSGMSGSTRFEVTSTFIGPGSDNAFSGGSGAKRFTELFAVAGAINTSDERSKTEIEAVREAALDAWAEVNFCEYKFIDAVDKKGHAARLHFGLVAQRVKEVFERHGLDPFAYGLLCYDEWDDRWRYVPAEYEHIPAKMEQLELPDGRYISVESEPATKKLIKEAYRVLDTKAGNRYGVRYDEALCLEAALNRRERERTADQLASLMELVSDMRREIDTLKTH